MIRLNRWLVIGLVFVAGKTLAADDPGWAFRPVRRVEVRDAGRNPIDVLAAASIPASTKSGYDHSESAEMYAEVRDLIRPSDYAMFYWLRPLLPGVRRLFDLGGNLGRSYFPSRRFLDLPDDLRWTICDVPSVVAAGRNLVRECDAPHIDFTTEFADADGSDVLLTCGTLQYLPDDLATLLRPLPRRPRHILVNRVPFSEQPTYYSVQNIGPTSCPYRIAEERQFVDALAEIGYETVDAWSCPESWFTVRRRPSLTVPSYTGYYLRLRADQNGQD